MIISGILAIAAEDDGWVPTIPIEIAYRIPGKGSWKRKQFKTDKAAEEFVHKLIEREGDDVDVRWAEQR